MNIKKQSMRKMTAPKCSWGLTPMCFTGMWQVSGRSDITDFEEVVRLDKEYIDNFSLLLDLEIILKTFKVVLGKEGSV